MFHSCALQISVAAFFLCQAPDNALRPAGREPNRALAVTGKVRYEASLIQYRFQRGDRIRLYARFVNATKQPVTIWSCGFWSNHEITLRDEHGVEPPLTQLGESCRKLFAPAGERNKNVPNVVKPGEEYRETSEIDLSRLYELDKGLYRFRVIYHDLQGPTPLRVVSNPVEFVIE